MTIPVDLTSGRALPPGSQRARRLIFGALLIVLVVVVGLPRLATIATDWLWYKEIGFQTVFTTSLVWRVALFVIGAAVTFAFAFTNVRIAGKGKFNSPLVTVNQGQGVTVDLSGLIPRFLLIGSALLALMIGASTSALWLTFLRGFNGVTVGVADPIFSRDVGFYLFTLPAASLTLNMLVALTTLTTAACAMLYGLRGEVILPPHRPSVSPAAARHLGILIAIAFVLVALRLWIVGTANLLHSTRGPLTGASYTDVHVLLPAIRISALIALAGAGLVIFGIIRGQFMRYATLAVMSYAGAALIGRVALPFAVERLLVVPNQLSRERPYLAHHIKATRQAWGLDTVTTRDLSGDAQLSMADIRANAATMDNVRLWERELVKQTFGQLQEIRAYYDFVSVTDDRYMIDGRYRQVHLSARELNTASLQTRTFINERLNYTHGMGVTLAPVNQVTAEGLPVLFIKDIPPASSVSLTLTKPQIYYGELTDGYVFTGTKQDEFDYPSGDADVKTRYTGSGGVPVGSILTRALYAWQFSSLKILLSADIADSAGTARVLYRRNIRQRATTALPFLTFDSEPFLVITDDGGLKWMLDAYTASAYYPYAQRTGDGTNYLRNSVKVVIDAYDGSVDAYIADEDDPIVRTYAAIFKGIFKPLADMPADLRRHMRYPGDLFRTQALLQARFHMEEPETFYAREDQWQFPSDGGQALPSNPYLRHIILRLPGETNPEFIYMMPFTPTGKDNLAAWMVARMDGDHYGELVVYRFPKQSLVFGPRQVSNRINQDTEISRQITLWDQSGSQVIRGELLVIPIEESLIYVQPIFTRAEGGTIPELKRVVVAHGSRVVMGETLEQGLTMLFGTSAGERPTVVADANPTPSTSATLPPNTAALLAQAQQHYDRAIAAQRAGNWAEYGREIDQLGAILRRLRGS